MIRKAVFVVVFLATVMLSSFGQPPPSSQPPPPVARPTPAERSELTEAQLEAKIASTLRKPVAWKPHTPPEFEVGFDMPRDLVRQTEWFYDESLGNAKLEMYLSLGEGATFLVGRLQMPYSITDRKLVREAFEEVVKEVAAGDSIEFKEITEFEFQGNPGVEMTAPVKNGYIVPRMRGLVIGRSMYVFFAMPHHSPPADEPRVAEDISRYRKDNDRFFGSLVLKKLPPPPSPSGSSPPIFASTFRDGIFRSEFFRFSFAIPTGWLIVSQDDVEGIRKIGRDYVAANSDQSIGLPKTRQNLATFVSKPLGSSFISSVAINIAPKPSPAADVKKLIEMTEGLVEKLPTYKIRKRPERTTLGGADAYTMESTIKFAEGDQNQIIYVVDRKGYAIVFTVAYYTDAERTAVMTALQGIRFEPL